MVSKAAAKGRKRKDGRAYCTVRPTRVWVTERGWQHILGHYLELPGGVELHEDTEQLEAFAERGDGLMPLRVVDAHFPPVTVAFAAVSIGQVLTPVEPGSGPRVEAEPLRCKHVGRQYPMKGCEACWVRWWRKVARARGLSFKVVVA